MHRVCRNLTAALDECCPVPVRHLGLWPGDASAALPEILAVDRCTYEVGCLRQAMLGVDVVGTERCNDPATYAAAGLSVYLVVDPFGADGVTLTEFRRGRDGAFVEVRRTRDDYETGDPYPIRLDLPSLLGTLSGAVRGVIR
ncbi:hypothetical protein [Actinoplanes sp. RD1]|uniref:hypothetical protein n=1 Tax=Actinoplanes sp. RD1 TaxID=3064538 RepID=UPI0027413C85|nr:hypothetical protein [Actinoplanes sp. RD1]